jgi:hypothetical protein
LGGFKLVVGETGCFGSTVLTAPHREKRFAMTCKRQALWWRLLRCVRNDRVGLVCDLVIARETQQSCLVNVMFSVNIFLIISITLLSFAFNSPFNSPFNLSFICSRWKITVKN